MGRKSQINRNTGGRLSRRKGTRMLTDGPYAETKELGCFWLEEKNIHDAGQISGAALIEREQVVQDKE